jgi:hypothetical protein
MDIKHIIKKIQHGNYSIEAGILTVSLILTIALFSPYHNSLVTAQKIKDVANNNNNNNTSALPTSTAAQRNATAESISKATGTNSTGITGFNSSNSMKNMINPVFKMTKNPLGNMSNPLANITNPLNFTSK